MTIYIVTADEFKTKAYTDKAAAEKRVKDLNYQLECRGSWNRARIEEVILNED